MNEMKRNANEGFSRSMGRLTKVFLLTAVMAMVLALFGSCSAVGSVDESELKITDSGFTVIDENWFSYYVIVENLTDKALDDVTVKMTAYDENGEEIHMKDLDSAPTIVRLHEGELSTGYVAPKGKGIYINAVNINQVLADCESIPSEMEFSIKGASWAKEERHDSLEVVDCVEHGYTYDDDRYYFIDDSEDVVYDGTETREECTITIKNTGDQDFVMTPNNGFDVIAVLRDGDGKVVASSFANLGMDAGDPEEMTIPAGEEVSFDASNIPYAPHDSIEFYTTYYHIED